MKSAGKIWSVNFPGFALAPILCRFDQISGSCGILTKSIAIRATAINSSEKANKGYTLPIILSMGIIVAITLALAVALLVVYGRAITTRSRSTFYSISACCAAGLLVVQLTLNIFGATDLLPLTGVTFPFISAGGSSIIGCWGLIAFIKAADERTYSLKR